MKLMIKHSLRNLVRTPLRTILYFLTIFVSVITVILCGEIYRSAEQAREGFAESYPFVATVMIRPQVSPEGVQMSAGQYLSLDVLEEISGSEQVVANNIDIHAGFLAEEEIINRLPDNDLLETDSPAPHVSGDRISVRAINTPYLVSEFFSGKWTLTSGQWFTEEQLRGGRRVMLISETVAEKYDFAVGDKIIYRTDLISLKYAEYTIVGIFAGESTLYHAYIPLEDYFRDRRDLFLGSLYLTDEMMNDLQISRIDLLLRDKDSGEKLIRYADEIGFDMTRYEIAVNDKKFKTVDEGLSAICRIAVTVLVSVCLTAAAVLILLSVFYHVAKQKEKHVLHALGMPEVKVAGIIACEILTLVIVAFSVGGIVGRCSSDALIRYVDDNILSSYEQEIQDGEAFTETPLSAPIHITLRESESQATSIPFLHLRKYNPEERELCRREVFYLNGDAVNVLGVESADIGGFVNRASYSQEILKELRNRTITFKCYVPSTSNYKVNDRIKIFVQDTDGGVQLGETRLVYTKQEDGTWLVDQVEDLRYYCPTDDVGFVKESFIIVGYFDPSDYPEGTDIVMALEELELMYQYCTVTSEKYRGNRYEFWEDVCLKSNK